MSVESETRNFYEVLHVSRDAPVEIIRTSYRTLMQALRKHPDLGGDTATAALINEAYAVLTNADKRAAYDASLEAPQTRESAASDAATAADSPRRVLDPNRQCVFCESPHNHGSIVEVDTNCTTCHSPLITAQNQRIELVDQRSVGRIGARHQISFYTHWPQRRAYTGRTEDVSLNGMRLVTKQPLRAGQRIKIVSEVLEAVASVTHCLVERRGWKMQSVAGLCFLTLRFAKATGGFVSDKA